MSTVVPQDASPNNKVKQEESAGSSVVRFGSVRVHQHQMTMGDNPGGTTRTGPPVTLSWNADASFRYSTVDSFSLAQQQQQQHHDSSSDSLKRRVHIIPGAVRHAIAKQDGMTDSMIKRTTDEIQTIRNERAGSAQDTNRDMNREIFKTEQQEQKLARRGRRRDAVRRLFGRGPK